MRKHDAIIIGGGHNGLTAAIALAMRGQKVLLFEKNAHLGGLAIGKDGMHPGLLYDTGTVRPAIARELQLERYGLRFTGTRTPVVLLGKEGRSVRITGNTDETATAIAQFSGKDAGEYRRFRSFIDKIKPLVNSVMNEAPPDMGNAGLKELWKLGKKAIGLKRLGNATMLEFLRVAPMCVADYLNEWFETDFLKAGLAAPALYGSFAGPWSAGTNLNFLIHECTAGEAVEGGGPALIAALGKAALANGVEIRTESEVSRIVIDGGTAVGVESGNERYLADKLFSSCSIKRTVLDLIAPEYISHEVESQTANLRARGTSAMINMEFEQPVVFKCGGDPAPIYRTGGSFDAMERAFDHAKYRRCSSEPILEIRVPDDRKKLNILVHYAPENLNGGWTEEAKDKFLRDVKRTLALYVDGEPKGAELLTPVDIEEFYGLPGGNIHHAEHAIDQLITRPFPSFMAYKTSIPGLFHCGSSAHPGGGLTCAPGYLAAAAARGDV